MSARGLSTRDIAELFANQAGRLLLASAVVVDIPVWPRVDGWVGHRIGRLGWRCELPTPDRPKRR